MQGKNFEIETKDLFTSLSKNQKKGNMGLNKFTDTQLQIT